MQPERLGPYLIKRKIGQGGMGTVFEATNIESGESAAVKILSPMLADDENLRKRFASEIDSLKKLRHPSIVRLIGFGHEDGVIFYAMELVTGTNLETELRQGRCFQWQEVARFSLTVCSALQHAHNHGIIHRDIKPANLMLDQDSQIMLTDFGIARLFGQRLTCEGGVIGTAEYMSPEQASGLPATQRSDLYALGCVMYSLLTGSPPFIAESFPKLLKLQQYAAPPPLSESVQHVPVEMIRTIERLLKKDPKDRFANATSLSRHLESIVDSYSSSPESESGQTTLFGDSVDESALQDDVCQENAIEEGKAKNSETQSDDSSRFKVVSSVSPPNRDNLPTPRTVEDRPSIDVKTDIANHFTPVDPDEDNDDRWSSSLETKFLSWRTFGLLAALTALAVALFFASRGPSTQELIAKIEVAAESGSPDRLADLDDEINEVLESLDSDDPRMDEIKEYRVSADRYLFERRLRAKARMPTLFKKLSPAEKLYAEALPVSGSDPERAKRLLDLLILLYDKSGQTEKVEDCVRFAKARQKKTNRHQEMQNIAERAAIEDQLERADQIISKNPESAAAILEKIIALFSDQPWAESYVQQAEKMLNELDL